MRDRWAKSLGVLLAVAGWAIGQGPLPPVLPEEVPALVLPIDPPPLGNGVVVSQPLQPVADLPPTSSNPLTNPNLGSNTVTTITEIPSRSLPSFWYSGELLLWWQKGQPLPPLVVSGRGNLPTLGSGGVSPLIGGAPVSSADTAGGRFVVGMALCEERTSAIEIGYLFLGTNTQKFTAQKSFGAGNQYLGLPYLNANSGKEDVALIAGLNSVGNVAVSTSGRVTGWEANLLRVIYDNSWLRLNALAGYRYFMVNEGLRIDSRSAGLTPGSGFNSADQFDAHNRFYGGQLGLVADVQHGAFFAEMKAKLGIGQTVEVVQISGLTSFANGPVVPVGFYAQPSNSGRTERSAFSVLPEAALRLGWKIGETSRVYVGYTLIYLSDAVRPGDQLDRTISPPFTGFGDRPLPIFVRNDFWAQGLTLGLEWRY